MKMFSSFNEILGKAKNAFQSFPITLIWAILGTTYLIWYVGQEVDSDVEFSYIKPILVSSLGMSWFIATRLLIRVFKEEQQKNKYWLIAIPILFLSIYYFSLPSNQIAFDDVTIPYRFVLYLITGHLLIFFSPFIFIWDKNAYWNYLKNIFLAFSKSIIFSLVLYLGLTIALVSLKYLFNLDFDELLYFKLYIFSIGIVNTWIFLADIPNTIHKQTTIDYPKVLLVFVKYILIPLTLLYLVILYAYSIKILINWNLPKGWVSYLVIALSILGFLIHILINPIQTKSESKLVKVFYPWFYYMLLPLILLLFVAIFKRIFEYGFTENRYLVLVLSFWIAGMTLYILYSKYKKLRNFPMSVTLLSLLLSFGFWGVFSVSKNSQAEQFKELYKSMVTKDFTIENNEMIRFESIVQYLAKRNALDKVSDVLGYNPSEVFQDKNYWLITDQLRDTLGIKVIEGTIVKDVIDLKNNSFYMTRPNETINIKGYDYMKEVSFRYHSPKESKRRKREAVNNKVNKYSFELDRYSNTALLILKQKDTLHKIDLQELLNDLQRQNTSEVSQDIMTLAKDYDDIKVKFLFSNIELRQQKNKTIIPPEVLRIHATVLLKEHQN